MYSIKKYMLNIEINTSTYIDNLSEYFEADLADLEDKNGDSYHKFIMDLIELFRKYDFEPIDEHVSDKNSKSYYVTFLRKHQKSSGDDIQVILFLRISDHRLKRGKGAKKGRDHYYAKVVQELSGMYNLENSSTEIFNIKVNNKPSYSFDQCLINIDYTLRRMIDNYNNS